MRWACFIARQTGATGYSGGFVARPTAPTYAEEVYHSDYDRSFLSLGLPDTDSPEKTSLLRTERES